MEAGGAGVTVDRKTVGGEKGAELIEKARRTAPASTCC